MQFLRDSIRREEIFNKDVLEVGSQNINGSPREVIAPYGPRTYWGVDYGPGKDVDLVIDATKIVERFGPSSFDVVISTEMLEHALDWRTSIAQMKQVLRPGGTLVISARGPGFPYHGFPHDHWRFTLENVRAMFSDMNVEVCKEDTAPGFLFKGQKTPVTGSADLTAIAVQPVQVPPEMIQVEGSVDLIVANWNTLPWLRLLRSQIRKFPPRIPHRLFVWDSASTDGSLEWLRREGIDHYASPKKESHAEGIHRSVYMTKAPYVAFIDVDAIPIQWWWLDEAIGLLQEPGVGIVGLGAGDAERAHHRKFVHPSFSVFRREVYMRLDLRPHIHHDYDLKKTAFDVGELMCQGAEDAGYSLRFVGETHIDLAQDNWKNRVVHCLSSTPAMAEKRADLPFVEMVHGVVKWHRRILGKFGVWEEFENYAREAIPKNPLCSRYVDKREVSESEIRLSIVIPTAGRPSLRQTLESIEAGGLALGDEVLVVADGPQQEAERICREMSFRIPSIRFLETRPTRAYGAHQRNVGLGMAVGTHALFIDDDDRYKPGALGVVRKALAQAPDRLHLFRVENVGTRHPFKILWNDPKFRLGNVTTQLICVPIIDGFLGLWPQGHCSDFGFLSDTIPRFGEDRIIWREEFIAELG